MIADRLLDRVSEGRVSTARMAVGGIHDDGLPRDVVKACIPMIQSAGEKSCHLRRDGPLHGASASGWTTLQRPKGAPHR